MKAIPRDRLTSAFHRIGACCCSSNWTSNDRGPASSGGDRDLGHVVTCATPRSATVDARAPQPPASPATAAATMPNPRRSPMMASPMRFMA